MLTPPTIKMVNISVFMAGVLWTAQRITDFTAGAPGCWGSGRPLPRRRGGQVFLRRGRNGSDFDRSAVGHPFDGRNHQLIGERKIGLQGGRHPETVRPARGVPVLHVLDEGERPQAGHAPVANTPHELAGLQRLLRNLYQGRLQSDVQQHGDEHSTDQGRRARGERRAVGRACERDVPRPRDNHPARRRARAFVESAALEPRQHPLPGETQVVAAGELVNHCRSRRRQAISRRFIALRRRRDRGGTLPPQPVHVAHLQIALDLDA